MEENFTDINVEISQDVFMECFLSKGDVVVFDWVFVVAKNHLNGNGVFFFPYLMEVFFFFSISFFFQFVMKHIGFLVIFLFVASYNCVLAE